MRETARPITKYNYNFLVSCCLLVACACAEKKLDYFPGDEGMRWDYSLTYITADETRNERLIIEILPPEELDGSEVLLKKNLQGDELVYSERASGLFSLGYFTRDGKQRKFVAEERLVVPRPALPGSAWQSVLRTVALENGGPRGVTIEEEVKVEALVTSINDIVKVKAGRFRDCLRIEKKGEKRLPLGKYQYIGDTQLRVRETSWYAPGVGLVKVSRREETDARLLKQGSYELELRSVTGIN